MPEYTGFHNILLSMVWKDGIQVLQPIAIKLEGEILPESERIHFEESKPVTPEESVTYEASNWEERGQEAIQVNNEEPEKEV